MRERRRSLIMRSWYTLCGVFFNNNNLGASLSEPHIDGDNAPSPRGTYLSI